MPEHPCLGLCRAVVVAAGLAVTILAATSASTANANSFTGLRILAPPTSTSSTSTPSTSTTSTSTTSTSTTSTVAPASSTSGDKTPDYSAVWAAAVTGLVAIVTGVITFFGVLIVPKRQAEQARATADLKRQRTDFRTLSESLTTWASKLAEVARLRSELHATDPTAWTLNTSAVVAEQVAYYNVLAHAMALPAATAQLKVSDRAEYDRRNELWSHVITGPLERQREAVLDAADEATQVDALRTLEAAMSAAVLLISQESGAVG